MTQITGPYAQAPNPANVMLGRGKLYFDKFVPGTTTRQGEQALGNCTSLEVEVKPEVKEKYESMDKASSLYSRGVTRETVSIKIVGDEFTPDNLANVLLGNIETISAPGATVAAETITPSGGPIVGRYYATAFRNLTALTSLEQGTTPLVLGTDYTVDLLRGRIYLLPSSTAILPTTPIVASYTYAEYSYTAIAIATQGTIDGYLRYESDNIKGGNYDGEWWHVSFIPSGGLAFIADDYGSFTLEGECIADAVNHPNEPIGRMISMS